MEKVDELSLDLRPAMLDDLGLLPALLWHFERYAIQTGVRVSLEHSGMERRFATLRVVEAMDGPILLSRCLLRSHTCEIGSYCSAHDVWANIQDHLVRDLEAVTMAKLVRRQDGKSTQ